VLCQQLVLDADVLLHPIHHKINNPGRHSLGILAGGAHQPLDCGPQVVMERFVFKEPGVICGQHLDFFFLTVRVEKIAKKIKQVRYVLPVEIMVDGIEEIIELRQQLMMLFVDSWETSFPLRIPYELAHGTSSGYDDPLLINTPKPTFQR
jgi:hypothetical protein